MIKEVSFEECIPLLKKLWPSVRVVHPVDNHCGLIEFLGNEYHLMKPKYFLYFKDGMPVATTHSYLMGPDTLRIRGTYCEKAYRKSKIAGSLIQYAISKYPEAKKVMTFPRLDSEKFYQSLGFKIQSEPFKNLKSKNKSGIAVKMLPQRVMPSVARTQMIDFKRHLLLTPPQFEALNPALTTRFLTPDDKPALRKLLESRDTSLKNPRDSEYINQIMQKLDYYLRIDEPHLVVATFQDDEILASASVNFWKSLPYWSIFYLRTAPSSMKSGIGKGGLGNCFQYMHYAALRLKRFRFYYMTRVSPNAFKRRNHDLGPIQKIVPEFRLYNYSTESFLPAGAAVDYRSFKNIQGEELFETSTYIGSGVLKEDHLLSLHFPSENHYGN